MIDDIAGDSYAGRRMRMDAAKPDHRRFANATRSGEAAHLRSEPFPGSDVDRHMRRVCSHGLRDQPGVVVWLVLFAEALRRFYGLDVAKGSRGSQDSSGN